MLHMSTLGKPSPHLESSSGNLGQKLPYKGNRKRKKKLKKNQKRSSSYAWCRWPRIFISKPDFFFWYHEFLHREGEGVGSPLMRRGGCRTGWGPPIGPVSSSPLKHSPGRRNFPTLASATTASPARYYQCVYQLGKSNSCFAYDTHDQIPHLQSTYMARPTHHSSTLAKRIKLGSPLLIIFLNFF